MRRTFWSLALVIAIAAPGAVLAEDIIYFTNGTQMPVRSHVVEDGMIHVDLGNDALMAFPEYVVERVVKAGAEVYLNRSHRPANVVTVGKAGIKVVPTSAGGSYPVSGHSTVPSKHRSRSDNERDGDDPNAKADLVTSPDAHGVQIAYPLRKNPNSSLRGIGAAGRTTEIMRSQQAVGAKTGAVRFGTRQALVTGKGAPNPSRPEILRIAPRVSAAAEKPLPPPPEDGGGDGSTAPGGSDN